MEEKQHLALQGHVKYEKLEGMFCHFRLSCKPEKKKSHTNTLTLNNRNTIVSQEAFKRYSIGAKRPLLKIIHYASPQLFQTTVDQNTS